MKRSVRIAPALLWLVPCLVHAVARPAHHRATPHPTSAESPTLHVETVPPIVIERAQLEAARTEIPVAANTTDEPGSTIALHHPPPVDAAASANQIVQGIVLQVTPTSVQLQERTGNTLRTLTRGSADVGDIKVGDQVEITIAPGSDTIILIAKNKN